MYLSRIKTMTMVSVVIPIFNEEEIIDALHQRLSRVFKEIAKDYEILFVDDGSRDTSARRILEIINKDPGVRLVQLSRNFGHQAAISAGLKLAQGDAVIVMDGDLQDPPEIIPDFIEKLNSGYDVVYAVRKERKESGLKQMAYAVFYRLLHLISDIDIPIDAGDFCIINRRVLDVINTELPERIRFVRGLRAYAGFRQTGLAYSREGRYAGRPKYTFGKLCKLAIDGLFDFSRVPLRLASYMGFFVALGAFIVGVFFIFHRIFNFKIFGYSPVDNPGLATTVVGIFFLGGVVLMVLGIIGEYIGRIYIEVKKRPFYLISKVYPQDDNGG